MDNVKLPMRLVLTGKEAEELVEEAFVRLLQQKEGLGDHPSLEGWLWKTLQHLILTEVRLAKYHREVPLEDANTWAAQEEERSELAEALPSGNGTRTSFPGQCPALR